jgi:ADP-heptose:LPS heptosyltransferase
VVRLAPDGPASIKIGTGFLSRTYKFLRDSWVPVAEADLDYFLSPYSPYRLRTEHEVGNWLLVYSGKKPLRVERKTIKTGERFAVDRTTAVKLLTRSDVDYDVQGLVDARSVLITRYGGFGDVLLTLPSVSEFMRRNPDTYVAYATSKANLPIIEHCGLGIDAMSLEEVYECGANFDAVVELSRWVEASSLSASTHRADIFAQRFGVELTDYSMPYHVTKDEREWAQGMLSGLTRPLVVMQAAGSIARRTPPEATLKAVIGGLRSRGCSVVIVDHREFTGWDVDLNLTGRTTTAEMMAVLEQADVVVCGDSGVMHAANALSRPVVAICGSVDPALRVRGQKHCRTLSGAQWSKCGPCDDKAPCTHPENCLASVPAEAIIQAVLTWQ